MERITDKMLDIRVQRLNEITNSPSQPWTTNPETGKMQSNIGNYHLSRAYGGVCLHRMMNTGGGVTCPLSHGHAPKRELFEKLGAYLDGIDYAKRELV